VEIFTDVLVRGMMKPPTQGPVHEKAACGGSHVLKVMNSRGKWKQ
jgi:hypothetical protein